MESGAEIEKAWEKKGREEKSNSPPSKAKSTHPGKRGKH
jgi:hypothetical protein